MFCYRKYMIPMTKLGIHSVNVLLMYGILVKINDSPSCLGCLGTPSRTLWWSSVPTLRTTGLDFKFLLANCFKMFNTPYFPPSLPLLIFSLYFSCLLGSRATVFWDHMTISQSRPPPLPMCSSPHGVASPAQSRPALWMPPALPCPPRRTTSSPTSKVHPGLKAHQSQEAEQQHVHMASKAETCHPRRTNRRWIHVLLSCVPILVCPVCPPTWPFFQV